MAMPPLTARRGNLSGWNEPDGRLHPVHALHPQEQLPGPAYKKTATCHRLIQDLE